MERAEQPIAVVDLGLALVGQTRVLGSMMPAPIDQGRVSVQGIAVELAHYWRTKGIRTGTRDGSEVVQLYVHDDPARVPRPMQKLKGFRKVALRAGEKQTITIPLARGAFSFYDPARKGWVTEAGAFTISIGSSSRDIRFKQGFVIRNARNIAIKNIKLEGMTGAPF